MSLLLDVLIEGILQVNILTKEWCPESSDSNFVESERCGSTPVLQSKVYVKSLWQMLLFNTKAWLYLRAMNLIISSGTLMTQTGGNYGAVVISLAAEPDQRTVTVTCWHSLCELEKTQTAIINRSRIQHLHCILAGMTMSFCTLNSKAW